MKKAVISLFVVLGLLISLLPAQALAAEANVDPAAISWLVTANVSMETFTTPAFVTDKLKIGVAPDAGADNNVPDAYDVPVKPPMGNAPFIMSYILHPSPNTQWEEDYRLSAALLSWPLRIRTAIEDEVEHAVTVTWDISSVPSGLGVKLKSGSTVVADMRATTSYQYLVTFESGVKSLTVEISSNLPPTVAVTYPNGGEKVKASVNVTATASDTDGTVASVAFEYSADNGSAWAAIATDSSSADGWSASWNTAALADGNQYLIRATATDNGGSFVSDVSNAAFIVDNTAPATPALSSPANGSFVNTTSPNLQWTSVSGISGVSYTLQYANNSGFTSPTEVSGIATTSYSVPGPMAQGAWYWRVKAVNGVALESGWSAAWAFTVDTTAPTPGAVNDGAGADITYQTSTTTVSANWAGFADATSGISGYVHRITTAADGSGALLYENTVSGTSNTATGLVLTSGVTYYNHVAATDNVGNQSAFAHSNGVTVDATAPALGTVNDGTGADITYQNSTTSMSANWAGFADATSGISGYVHRITTAADGSGALLYENTVSGTSNTATGLVLTSGVTYYNHVAAIDNVGNQSAFAHSNGVTVDTTAPTLGAVNDGAGADIAYQTSTASISANWAGFADASGISGYVHRITTAADGSGALLYENTVSGTSNTATGLVLTSGVTYYNHVAAIDNVGNQSAFAHSNGVTVDTTAPVAPALASPANGALTNDTTPTLTWSAVSDPSAPVTYSLQVADNSSFTAALVVDLNNLTSTNYTLISPVSNGTYYWKARATDAAGNAGPWSASRSFTIDTTAPAAPALVSPANGAVTNDATPTLEWSAVSDPSAPVTYSLQIATDSAFSSIVISQTGLSALSFTPESDLDEETHYWRVKASDAAGNTGPWSASRSFTIDTIAPAAPALVSPANGALTNDTTPTLSWSAVSDPSAPVTYSLQIATDSAFSSIVIDQTGLSALSFTPVAALAQGTWYWRVKASDAAVNAGLWSASRSFTVDTTAPDAPGLVSPANGAFTNDTTPTLTWSAVSDPSAPVAYSLQVASDSAFSSVVIDQAGLSALSFTPVAALAQGTWYWRVKASDAAGNTGLWSASRSFTIDTTAPAAPALVSPIDGALTNDTTPTLTWSAVSDATPVTYSLQVASDSAFSSILIDQTGLSALSFTPAAALAQGTWYWRVKASDAAGNTGLWSASRSFTVDTAAPAAPALVSPIDGALTNDTTPTLTWSAVSDPSAPVNYSLQVASDSAFSSILIDQTGLSALSFTPAAALAQGAWYWRVKASDAAGNTGLWSASRSFTIDTIAPAAPALVSPANGALTNDTTPTLTWSAVSDPSAPVTYSLQVADNSSFTAALVVDLNNLNSASYTLISPLSTGTYYWKASATDAAGNTGLWSASRSFTVDTAAPAAPALVSPIDGALTNDTTPTLTWSAVSDPSAPVNYSLQVASDSAFSSVVIDQAGLSALSFTPAAALAQGAWYWRVKASDAAGNTGLWSASRSFTIDTIAPAAPALVSPANGALTNDTTPTLTWSAVSDPSAPVTYSLQVADNSSFTAALVVDLNNLNSASYTLISPLSTGTYYWKASATDAAGNTGLWSASRSFTVDTAAPAAPALVSPVDGALTNDTTPTLTWSAVSDPSAPVNYSLQIADNSSFIAALVVDLNNLTSTSYTPATPLAGGAYYWRVNASDAAGNTGLWSASRSFTIDTTAPAAPALVSPANGALTNDTTPTLTWSAVSDPSAPVGYSLQVASDSAFSSIVINQTGLPPATYTPPVALAQGTWYWRVNASDAAGNTGLWSASRSFTVDTTAPAAPVLASPADGAFTNDTTPTLTWSAVSDPSAPVAYSLQVASDSAFSSVVIDQAGLSALSFTPVAALAQGTWYWRVSASDAAGNTGLWSASRSFTIDTIAPAAPVLASPADGARTNDATPALEWSAVSDPSAPVTYSIQVATDSAFTDIVISQTGLSALSFTPDSDLDEATHYWRVKASDAAGNAGPWSASRSFTVDTTAPAAPVLVSPADGALTNDSTPTMTWSAVSDPSAPVTYSIQVATDSGFTGIVIDQTGLSALSFTPDSDLGEETHYWRVKASDAAGNAGPWSDSWSFTVDTTAPATPVLVSPANEALTNDSTPTLTWSAVSDPSGVKYSLQVADNSSFTAALVADLNNLTSTSYTLTSPLSDGTYYWKVMATDNAGNPGPWSTPRRFTVDTTPPAAPTPGLPAEGALLNNKSLHFTWSSVSDASLVTYTLQVDNNADFSSPEVNRQGNTDSFFDVFVELDGSYQWRVKAVDGMGNSSAWSAVRHFTIDTTPPGAPAPVSPPDGSLSSDNTPNLDWTDVGDPSGTTYALQVSGEASFTGLEVNATVTPSVYNVPGALPDGTHYWRVRTVDSAGNSGPWSFIWSFTVDTTAPGVPALLSPADDVFTSNAKPKLDWLDVSDPSGLTYSLQVDNNPDFSSHEVAQDRTDSFFDIFTDLADGTYDWRIKATDGAGNSSAWSASRTFTVDTQAPATPQLLNPGNGWAMQYGPQNPVTLDWAPVSDSSGVSYVLRLERGASMLASANALGIAADQYDLSPDLALAEGNYYWSVLAVDGAGNESQWPASFTFTLDSNAPAAPAIVAPAPGSYAIAYDNISYRQLTLDWSDVSDASGIWWYEFQVAQDSGFTQLVEGRYLTSSSVVIDSGAMNSNGFGYKYLFDPVNWRVRAIDRAGWQGPWSAGSFYWENAQQVGTPDLVSPPENAFVDTSRPSLDWSDATAPSGVAGYILSIQRATSVLAQANATSLIPGSDYALASTEALPDGKYYWKVKSVSVAGNEGYWSATRSFTVASAKPLAPDLQSPADAAFINNTAPSFDWSDVSDPAGVSYDFQVSVNSSFTSTVVNKTGLSASGYTLAAGEALAPNTYFWRARAINGASVASDWSAARSFTVDTADPAAPALISPPGGTYTANTTPAFDWSDVVDPSGISYALQIAYSDTFATLALGKTGLGASGYTPAAGEALGEGSYFWRARATDGAGNSSSWSAPRQLTVDLTTPATPNLISPAGGALVNDNTPLLHWSDVADPSGVSYRLQVSANTSFGTTVIDASGLATGEYTPSAALTDGLYQWRVRTTDGAGNTSAWSAVRTFTVDTTAPAAPNPLSPANGLYTSNNTPVLDWTDVADANGVSYILQIDTSSAFNPPLLTWIGLNDSIYDVDSPLPEGGYLWRASAIDSAGNQGIWSTTWSFTVDRTAPPAPALAAPADGASINTNVPTFDWSDVVDVSGVNYRLQISALSDFTNPVLDKTAIAGSTYTLSFGEALGDGSYFWRAKAVDNAGNEGSWSASRSFGLQSILWLARISTSGTDLNEGIYYADAGNYAGVAIGASNQSDSYDIPEPPTPPSGYVRIFFPHPEWPVNAGNYGRDVRPTANQMTWVFRVQSTFGGTISLDWDVSQVPGTFDYVRLVDTSGTVSDPTDDVILDMRAASSYQFDNPDEGGVRVFNFVVKTNDPPAVTVVYPNGGNTVSGSTTVSANASAPTAEDAPPYGDSVSSVKFEYSSDNGSTWTEIGTDSDGSNGWSTTWDSLAIPEGGNYLVRATATDSHGATAVDASDAAFTVVHSLTLSTVLPSGWNMISFPLIPQNSSFADVLGDDIAPLFVYWYNPLGGGYNMWPGDSFGAEAGKGYWARVTAATTIDATGFPTPSGDFVVSLKAGWNMIGSPRSYDVSWGQVKVKVGSSTVSITEAHNNGWVLRFLYRYDTASGSYVVEEAPGGTLAPWAGYLVKAMVDADLIIPSAP